VDVVDKVDVVDEKENQPNKQTIKIQQIKKQVLELCSQYNAITDWKKKLDIRDEDPVDTTLLYSIQVQNVLLDPNDRPYLFFCSIVDIKKVRETYLLIACQTPPTDLEISPNTSNINLSLRLACDSEQVQQLLEQKATAFNRYAIIATVKTIRKPNFTLGTNIEHVILAQSDTPDDTDLDEIYDGLELEISCNNDNTFIAIGKCEKFLFLGKDDWINDDPSEFKEFYECFGNN
jgi:hypothetical protein